MAPLYGVGAVPGYAPLGDKARRYVNLKTGEVISQRQFIKLRTGYTVETIAAAHRAGFEGVHSVQAERMVERYRAKVLRETGKNLTYEQAIRSTKFQNAMSKLNDHPTSKAPRGPRAKALVDLGWREPDWDWDVGDSPGVNPQ